jgi:predicted ATP-dependent endonuclease of OLD family
VGYNALMDAPFTAAAFGVRTVSIRGFRSARSVGFAPGPICGLVGGPSVGKSNVLEAIWMLLRRNSPDPGPGDVTRGTRETIRLAATLADGSELSLEASPPGCTSRSGPPVPVLFLPASERSGALVAGATGDHDGAGPAAAHFTSGGDGSSAAPAVALVAALERLCGSGERGLVLLVEEPELFLRPQAQRYLYRLLRTFATNGNQVLYSTHSPAFLNVGRLGELALVDWRPDAGTTITQPEPLPADSSFRALSEVDAERGELFLARAVLLVEGRTEKLTFPFVFTALGHDADREAVAIVECGGKPNLLLFIRICEAASIPYVVVHDRDAAPGKKPILGERVLNAQIAELVARERVVVLAPNFESVAGLRGRSHKPARAWQLFSSIDREQVPDQLRAAVEKVLALARRDG